MMSEALPPERSEGVGSPVFTPEALRRAATPGQLAIYGDRIVYTLRTVDRTELWQVDYRSGEPQQLTKNAGADSTPRFAPDGTLAFLRAGADGVAQVCLLRNDEVATLTAFPRGVHDLSWYPDSSALAVLAEDDKSPYISGDSTAIVLTRRDWRADGEGDRLHPRHVHRVPVDGGAPIRLTCGAWSARRPRVDANGTVYLLGDPSADADLHGHNELLRIAADGGLESVLALGGGVRRYHLTVDGLRALGSDSDDDAEPPRWYDATGKPVVPTLDRWSGLLGDETELHDWSVELDDDATITTLSEAGSTVPVELDSARPLLDGPMISGALAADGERRVAVLALGSGAVAPDVYALAERPRRLTAHGDWLAKYAAPRFDIVDVAGPAGTITVNLLYPPGDSREPRATVLLVHGGPTGQWGVVPTTEALLLASAGYLVAMPNIRGSIDRGPHWVAALGGRWGEADAADCLAVCDALVATGRTDAHRLGISGLSYGGFLTNWLIATTDRFAAAVSENGVTNQVSAWANCADGPRFNSASGLADPLTPEGAASLWRQSPLAHVADVHTPLLMLQADDDRTCPAADNEQFFVALRTLRRAVEYVRYPDESHLMQGTGRIDRRIDRHRRVLDWFGRYLPC